MNFDKKYVIIPVISIVSMIITYMLNHDLKLGAIVAASIVGLVAGLTMKNALYAVVGYSASFIGMSSTIVIPVWFYLIPVGLIHAIVVIALTKKFVGWGGKAGTMAFIAVAVSSVLLILLQPIEPAPYTVAYYQPNAIELITSYSLDIWMVGILSGVIGIMATILVREKCCGGPKANDAVVGSAIVALIAGIIAPIFVAPPYSIASLAFAAPIIASGTYAGMAARKVLPKLVDFVIVGIVVGILNVLLWPIFPGFGGRLGTIGLISCAIWMVVIKLRQPKALANPPSAVVK